MVTLLRRLVMPFILILLVSLVSAQSADPQQSSGTPPAGGQAGASGGGGRAGGGVPAPASNASPEVAAYQEAMRLSNMADRVAALNKYRADFPNARNLVQVDSVLIAALVPLKERHDEINDVVDRMLGRIADDATPEVRFNGHVSPAATLISQKVLLDRAEALLKQAEAMLPFAGYAERQRESARTAKRPEPTDETLQRSYSAGYASRLVYERARIAAARGQAAQAEAGFRETLKLAPTNPSPVTAMLALYREQKQTDKIAPFLEATLEAAPTNSSALTNLAGHYENELKQPEKAEALLKRALAATPPSPVALNSIVALYDRMKQPEKADAVLTDAAGATPVNLTALSMLVSRYERANTADKAEPLLLDIVKRDPLVPQAQLALGKIEQKRGNDAKALEHFLTAATILNLNPADKETLKTLFTKARGSDAGLDAELDTRYLAVPNPVTPAHYTPTAKRSNRLVLLEMFTGSACGPCVAADLAFDAVMERYPAGTIVPVAYHVHVPGPDPMTTSGSKGRNDYYEVQGVPTFNIDGLLGRLGGGGRTNTQTAYDDYIGKIDAALETPAEASLTVRGVVNGDSVHVTANVTRLPPDAKDLRLHILLVQKDLMFGGENGVRHHPVVVRAVAGENGAGLPLSASGTQNHTFSLAAVGDDITKSLAADIERRRAGSPNSTATYLAEGRAMTEIDLEELSVVAFVQAADKKVLQAAQGTVSAGSIPAGTGRGQLAPPAPQQGAPARPPAPASAPPAPRPEQQALSAAGRIADPGERLAALEQIHKDFPKASNGQLVDQQILMTLGSSFPDRLDALNVALDRYLDRAPDGATAELRLTTMMGPIGFLVGQKLLLDRSEKLLADALEALDVDAFVEAQQKAARQGNRPEPKRETLTSQFNSNYRARGLELLARVHVAKGNAAKGEATYRDAVTANPGLMTAVNSLIEIYTRRGDGDAAVALLRDAIAKATSPVAAVAPRARLAELLIERNDLTGAKTEIDAALDATPSSPAATLALAKLEAKQGNERGALNRFVDVATNGTLRGADYDVMVALYRKLHGSTDTLDATIDEAYRAKFSNPVKVDAYKPSDKRSNRLVLLEMFTGSACGPCVSADLAFEGVMERYGSNIVPLAYHVHIPGPDPMTNTGSETRRLFYGINGVPTLKVDGTVTKVGGGPRTSAPNTYKGYLPLIEPQLETPAFGEITVKATATADAVTISTRVTDLPRDANDLRLVVVLAEKHLSFSGENGIRFHPMVVRAVNGEKADGLPISADGTYQHTFTLDAIVKDITAHLEADIARRRDRETGGAPRAYNAEGRPMIDIDPSQLVVVAYLQGADQKVLQATQADVAYSGPVGKHPR